MHVITWLDGDLQVIQEQVFESVASWGQEAETELALIQVNGADIT